MPRQSTPAKQQQRAKKKYDGNSKPVENWMHADRPVVRQEFVKCDETITVSTTNSIALFPPGSLARSYRANVGLKEF